ncbi:GAF and ANTAR domain-containing protein [Kribbella deserti]|uniref:GAF and ANTAR domain-containing protein n=1 Tax=Kribbella deserti TaxID=1926257 RepID=A0ABV6QJ75_9ACTN
MNMPLHETQLVELVTDVAEALKLPLDLDEALRQITMSAVDSIDGIEYASISVTARGGAIETLAPTDSIATKADELQYELGEGPSLDAAITEPVVQVDDLAADPRWPRYGPQAADLGLSSQLAYHFRAEPHARGALNLYGVEPHVIDAEARLLSEMFAELVAVAMGWSRQQGTMNAALQSHQIIGQAVGILIERYRLDSTRAFAFLVRTSQTGNTKLRTVAEGIVADAIRQAQ